jgi:hypothetical protein
MSSPTSSRRRFRAGAQGLRIGGRRVPGGMGRRAAVPWVLLAALGVAPLAAQDAASLASLDRQYQSAEQAHHAALTAAEAQRLILDEEFARVELARSRGDEDALDEAYRRFRTQSRELQRLEDRTRQTESQWIEARQALLNGLDRERRALEAQLPTTANPRTTGLIYDRLQGVTSQYQELEQTPIEPSPPALLFSQSSLSFDPRDGRDDFQAKAELLEWRAETADSVIADLDRQIERLESRLRFEQNSRDFLGGLERFGDAELPAIAPRPESVREEGVPADEDDSEEGVPLEQRISELKTIQDRLRQQRDLDLSLANEFRKRLAQSTE